MRSEGAVRRTGPEGGIPLSPIFVKKSREASQQFGLRVDEK